MISTSSSVTSPAPLPPYSPIPSRAGSTTDTVISRKSTPISHSSTSIIGIDSPYTSSCLCNPSPSLVATLHNTSPYCHYYDSLNISCSTNYSVPQYQTTEVVNNNGCGVNGRQNVLSPTSNISSAVIEQRLLFDDKVEKINNADINLPIINADINLPIIKDSDVGVNNDSNNNINKSSTEFESFKSWLSFFFSYLIF
jgi:hypothetical protein